MGITLSKNAIGSDPSLVGTRSDPKDSYRAPSQWKTYDYVIVGGGTAGCVLASRLSENPNATVLLVEAGQSHKRTFFTKFPMGFAKLLKTKVDWEYYSVCILIRGLQMVQKVGVMMNFIRACRTSSARMGISEKSSVIDSKLCVHGVDGLRVVDASAFPTQVSGHPCAVVIAMAEKAADLIKAAAEA
ncbi:GMC oxidoreductase-domain-containing protein [Hysterangium stoloniferum]|nr:GMC oxidoreductase-domain-containing protein [Hysterangium stoloniferum]